MKRTTVILSDLERLYALHGMNVVISHVISLLIVLHQFYHPRTNLSLSQLDVVGLTAL